MLTVNEVSKLAGVSVRTLHYYDRIGLLDPTKLTESGYRLYDDTALERLQNILLFRELQFPLKEIKAILDSPNTEAYREFEKKSANRTGEEWTLISAKFMGLFAELGTMRECSPEEERVQAQVEKLRAFITEHYYNCTIEIFGGLGKMYNGGGSMTENIDRVGGTGTAELADKAVRVYYEKRKAAGMD